jgi:predicted NUDIX family NTP pyrophosphohydrolase
MAKKQTAGILMYRWRGQVVEVFLVHPGGPFWANKDAGAWSIPKGEPYQGEDLLAAAKREFQEETGYSINGDFVALRAVKQAGGKIVHAWAVEGDCDAESIKSNTFSIEWPPRSGKRKEFPEVDRAAWLSLSLAKEKIQKNQRSLLEQLEQLVASE